jgi:hypothetical protein
MFHIRDYCLHIPIRPVRYSLIETSDYSISSKSAKRFCWKCVKTNGYSGSNDSVLTGTAVKSGTDTKLFKTDKGAAAMRAEIENLVVEIKQAISLLRRHL